MSSSQEPKSSDAARTGPGPTPEFLAALKSAKNPLVAGHVTPDADCLGSAFGLALAMRERGISATVGLPSDTVAGKIAFMLELACDVPRVPQWENSGRHDALIVVDTAAEKRVNLGGAPPLGEVSLTLNIDHHITNTDFARHNWVDPHASSTCEMIAVLLQRIGWNISSDVASLLYAGIHGDTAGFSLPNTTAAALHVAADLVRAGADVAHIGERLCRSQNRSDFELLRRVYDHTTVIADGRIAYSWVTHEDMNEAGCRADDIDDQVSIPRALRGVQLALLFSEAERGVVRINLRGEGKVTVVELAQRFGGGGHSQSAGVKVKNKPMQQVIDEVVAAAVEHLRSQTGR